MVVGSKEIKIRIRTVATRINRWHRWFCGNRIARRMTSTQPPATSQLDSTNELGENEADENHEWKPAPPLLAAETGCHRWPVFADKNASCNRNKKTR